jgi:hypothetical protein
MCKKLMFLISLVYLLGLASSASAANLEVDWPDVYTVSGTEEYDFVGCYGTIIVPAGATLIANSESEIDGNGDDGEGGSSYAKLVVDGGTFIMNERINLGKDHDAYLIVQNGGTFLQTDQKVAIPDNDGGVHRLIIIDGLADCREIDLSTDSDRYSDIQIGCSGIGGVIQAKLIVGNTDNDDNRDPSNWVLRDPNEGSLYDYPEGGCAGSILTINDLGDNTKEVYYFVLGPGAWDPSPDDGATGEAAVTCDMVLSWKEGNCLGLKGRNHIYFSTDEDCVTNSPSPTLGWTPPPCYLGQTSVGTTTWNVGPLPLWTKYYWRVDQGCPTMVKGDIWSFTTGCPLIPGDANLDCMVNFVDYAEVASTWMGEQFFPEGCTP